MNNIQKVIDIWTSEIGMREKASNRQLYDKDANAGNKNYTKYAHEIDTLYPNFYNGPKQGFPYCDVTYDWVFIKAFGEENAKKMLYQPSKSCGAGCENSAGYYRANGAFTRRAGGYIPKIGDQIFFGPHGHEEHTGIVTGVIDNRVHTMEANTSDMVARRSYALSDPNISGYGRPNWSILDLEETKNEESMLNTEDVDVILPTLSTGSKGRSVKAMQILLKNYGYSVGVYGADGDFGVGTKNGLILFQKANNLNQDGVCGLKTWTKLLL